jgi:hypothetical protein
MKRLCSLILVLLAGCLADGSKPPVSCTRVPGTKIEVILGGPDKQGNYFYAVTLRENRICRDLGRLQLNETTPARCNNLGDGIYRIQWGDAPIGPFVVIDAKKELVVEDSRSVIPKNQPLDKPES